MPAPELQLDYVSPTTVVEPRRRSVWWTILALPTLVIPFVHFGCDYSPAGVLVGVVKDKASLHPWDVEGVMLCILAVCLCYGALAFAWRVVHRRAVRSYTA